MELQEIHKELDLGFLQSIYENALCIAFLDQNIPSKFKKEVRIFFKYKFSRFRAFVFQ